MKPLAYRMRPQTFADIVGQDHLVGEKGVLTRMLANGTLSSSILYGPPGCGKTSIAEIIAAQYRGPSMHFNASFDNKAKLKDIVEMGGKFENAVCIIDEIHRLKKDTQDYLLPVLEAGTLTIIGLTTENPYRSINPAIRSRCHIYRMKEIREADVIKLLKRAILQEGYHEMSDDILHYLAAASGCEIRSALNMLEVTAMLDESELTRENVEALVGQKVMAVDEQGENYYDLASAMIKSIRGSDPDAALHYLARLMQSEDLEFICRRLMILAYEDVGMGNPNCGPRVYAACQAALFVGLPEAQMPLAYAVVDLATSPKSNSAYKGLAAAMADLQDLTSMQIPPHILNKELKSGKYTYKYPHDYPGDYVEQQYLPDALKDRIYYVPKDSGSYERAVKEYLKKLDGKTRK